ncbi:MAG: flavodoxin family protein [Candidatus Lokiarchaeota archaeon]|nr:flavodoxin family protein [Candidatus Lokiarchaeota archaeon]
MKTILIFNGSPRNNGNTSILCDTLSQSIKNHNGKTEIYAVNSMNIHPCRACDVCMKNKDGMCVQQDDMIPLYGKILDASGIVFAAPIYWFNYSAQLKLVIDRFYALFGKHGNALKGKAMAGILVYGGSNEQNSGANNAINALKMMFSYLGGVCREIVHGTAMDLGEVVKNKGFIEKVQQLGKSIMQSI